MVSPPALQLRTLGRLTLLDEAGDEHRDLATRKRKLAMLTLLAVTKKPWTRDALLDLFWGEQDHARARHSLSDALSHLRRVLGPTALTHRRVEVELSDELPLTVDVLQLQEAARRQDWTTVVSLYRGPFFDGVFVGGSPRLEQWIDGERRRFEAFFTTAARFECDRLLQNDQGASCAELAARWLAVAPMSPHAALFQLRALAADGSAEGEQRALDAYQALARRLQRDFGANPDQVVAAVADELRDRAHARQAPAAEDPAAEAPAAEAPAAEAPAAQAPAAQAPTTLAPDTLAPDALALDSVSVSTEPVREATYAPQPPATRRSGWSRRRLSTVALAAAACVLLALGWRGRSGAVAPPTTQTMVPIVLTASPQARALYERAIVAYDRDGNREAAVRLLDSAIAYDSTFAMAYRRLGLIYDNGVDTRSRAVAMLTLAARYADRLPEEERLFTIGSYHRTVTGNFAEAATAYRALLELSPNNARAWGNLGTVYDYLGDHERAVAAYERSLTIDPKRALTWMNVADARYNLGDVDGAMRALDSMALAFPGHPGLFMRTATLAHAEGDRARAETQLRALITSAPENIYLRAIGEMLLAKAYWSWGRFDDGNAARTRSILLDRQRGAREAALVGDLDIATAAVWIRGDTTSARTRIMRALQQTPLDSIPLADRPYLDAVIALATVSETSRASRLLQEYVQRADSLDRRRNMAREHHARGMIAFARGQYTEAGEEFAQAADALCAVCGLPELALTYERRGFADSARTVRERYRTIPSQRRLDMTAVHGAR